MSFTTAASEERQRTGRGNRARDLIRLLSEDNGEAGLEVEVDVAVEEPRARVVRLEADRDIVGRATPSRDGIAPDGVVEVVFRRVGAADDCEGVL